MIDTSSSVAHNITYAINQMTEVHSVPIQASMLDMQVKNMQDSTVDASQYLCVQYISIKASILCDHDSISDESSSNISDKAKVITSPGIIKLNPSTSEASGYLPTARSCEKLTKSCGSLKKQLHGSLGRLIVECKDNLSNVEKASDELQPLNLFVSTAETRKVSPDCMMTMDMNHSSEEEDVRITSKPISNSPQNRIDPSPLELDCLPSCSVCLSPIFIADKRRSMTGRRSMSAKRASLLKKRGLGTSPMIADTYEEKDEEQESSILYCTACEGWGDETCVLESCDNSVMIDTEELIENIQQSNEDKLN